MLKKVLSLMLIICLLFTATAVFAANFSDLPGNFGWAEEAIVTLSGEKIINGYPDGTFKPANNITKEEAISLFARILGAAEDYNASVVSLASIMHEDVLQKYDTYATDAAAYLMYKNVLSEDDLATYLSSVNKSEPLKRYEAATLIAKCLGGDIWLKSNPDVTLSYKDAASVPAAAKGYVYFASQVGIIQGVGDNEFAPMGNVNRAQIAVMMHRIFNQMDYTYEKGIISKIDTIGSTISIRNIAGETEIYSVNKNIAVMVDGEQGALSDLSVGQELIITFSNGALYSMDVVELVADETFEAIYKGKTTDSSKTSIKLSPVDTTDTKSYIISTDVVVSYNNKNATISDLSVGDYVTVSVTNGKITVIAAESKTTNVNDAKVEAITFDPDAAITVRTKQDELLTFSVKSGATIRKNSAVTTFSELLVGDTVDLTIEYGKISSVVAVGITKNITGQIEEITISKTNSYLTIDNGKGSTKYTVSRDANIVLDGAAATLYDLRLGYEVEIEASSSTIKSIKVKSVSAPLQITGQVTLVNTSYNMIRISYLDSNGDMKEAQVFAKSTVKILDSNDGKMKALKDVKIGQNVTVAGVENLGIFEANSIMILANTQ